MTKLSDEQREKVAKLYDEGLDINMIKARFGLDVSTIRKIARKHGVPPKFPQRVTAKRRV